MQCLVIYQIVLQARHILKIILYIYVWLCWIIIAASGFFLVSICRLLIVIVLYCGAQALGHSGFSSCGMWAQGSMAQAHGLNCSVTWGIFVDQGWNPFLLLCQADSLPLSLWGSPKAHFNLYLIRDFFFPD